MAALHRASAGRDDQLVHQRAKPCLELRHGAVVSHHVGRPRRLFLLRELAARATLEQVRATVPCARGPHGVVGDHGDGGVEGILHPRLEEQRHLDHREGRLRRQGHPPLGDPLADQRMEDATPATPAPRGARRRSHPPGPCPAPAAGAISSPQRSTRPSRIRSSASSSCTRASLESVAAPSFANAAKASDLPAAIAAGEADEGRADRALPQVRGPTRRSASRAPRPPAPRRAASVSAGAGFRRPARLLGAGLFGGLVGSGASSGAGRRGRPPRTRRGRGPPRAPPGPCPVSSGGIRSRNGRFCRLGALDAQRDAPAGLVDLEDPNPDLVARLHHLARDSRRDARRARRCGRVPRRPGRPRQRPRTRPPS